MKFLGISNRIRFFSLGFCIISFSLQAQTEKQVVYGDDFVFNLDYETSFEAFGPVRYKDHFAFYNPVNSSLKLFDQKSLTVASTINIVKEGPKSTAKPFGVFSNGMGVFTLDFYKQVINQIDANGFVIKTYNISSQAVGSNDGLLPLPLSSIYFQGPYIYIPIPGGISLKTNFTNHSRKTILRVNKENGTKDTFLNYPENYSHNIGGGRPSILATTSNSKSKSLLVSYPLDHRIFELTIEGEIKVHMAKSSDFDDFDDFYYKEDRIDDGGSNGTLKKWLGNYSYSFLFYDEFTDTYWRFVNLPLSYAQLNQKEVIEAKFRIYKVLVLDKNFKKVAESDELQGIDLSLMSGKIFSTEKGIHIYAKNQENEEEMRFKTLKIK
ncbi:uncharacterized protein DUF4221 [Roseivirga ehrenbergii]|nr:DUF4221 family protein [Roseivirga ehrenbergii]TCL10826.1 uncharacterized protein DUF4221 [Roseivirga ehrenbergii]